MHQSIRDRLRRLADPKNKAAVATLFKSPQSNQDLPGRQAVITFLKLLMAVAYADSKVEAQEMAALKSFAFGHCLNELEWREVDFFARAKPSQAELSELIEALGRSARGPERQAILAAFREMVGSDGELAAEEAAIVTELESALGGAAALGRFFGGLGRTLIGQGPQPASLDADAKAYVFNPAAVLLKRRFGHDLEHWQLAGAGVGLVLHLAHGDKTLHAAEQRLLLRMLGDWAKLPADDAALAAAELSAIPTEHLELTHLARIVVDHCDLQARCALLLQLFELAFADGEFHADEEQIIRLVSQYLMIPHRDFIAVKIQAERDFSAKAADHPKR